MLRFTTAGESHGQALVTILDGMPAGVPLSARDIDVQLARRQQEYGRGRGMQVEQDTVELLAGVRAGDTIGSGFDAARKRGSEVHDEIFPGLSRSTNRVRGYLDQISRSR